MKCFAVFASFALFPAIRSSSNELAIKLSSNKNIFTHFDVLLGIQALRNLDQIAQSEDIRNKTGIKRKRKTKSISKQLMNSPRISNGVG
jgi:hypothetical protein